MSSEVAFPTCSIHRSSRKRATASVPSSAPRPDPSLPRLSLQSDLRRISLTIPNARRATATTTTMIGSRLTSVYWATTSLLTATGSAFVSSSASASPAAAMSSAVLSRRYFDFRRLTPHSRTKPTATTSSSGRPMPPDSMWGAIDRVYDFRTDSFPRVIIYARDRSVADRPRRRGRRLVGRRECLAASQLWAYANNRRHARRPRLCAVVLRATALDGRAIHTHSA